MIKTRFAPSPTGFLHIGGARTALFSWLYARQGGGNFVLRIEDTDRERSTQESVQAILDGMEWLGLDWEEGPYYQTERFPRYQAVIEQLLQQGDAYPCYCSKETLDEMREAQRAEGKKPRYDGRCRHRDEPEPGVQPVIRLKTPTSGSVVFDDQIRGEISVENAELDDLILARSDGSPTYNFTVVVDDMDMGITHVIRGDDHINNTPRQLNILQAIGGTPPTYAHVPMILGSDGKRLSKRHGALGVMEYADDGYLPEALLNCLVRMGWSHGDQEIFSLDEMKALFSLAEVQRSAAAFDPDKLLWLNQHYLKSLPLERIVEAAVPVFAKAGIVATEFGLFGDLIDVQRQRCKTLIEMVDQSRFFFFDFEAYDEKSARKNLRPESRAVLDALLRSFSVLTEWQPESVHSVVKQVAESLDLKLGKVAQPLRVALSGGSVSPAIDMTIYLLGKEKTAQRISQAIEYIDNIEDSE